MRLVIPLAVEPTGDFSVGELMTVTMSRHLVDGEVAVMGAVSMMPMAACRLSQQTHAPNLWYVAGGSGAVNPRLEPLVYSSCDYSLHRAEAVLPLPEVILLEGRPRFDVFFAGGLQIDRFGNCNLVCVGEWEKPRLRGPGTVGLPFLPRAGRVILYTVTHTVRTFVDKVDFNSGPGFLAGKQGWSRQGVPGQGPALVVTNLAVLDFHAETGAMRLRSVHPGVTVDEVRANTGFDLGLADAVGVTPGPTAEELKFLRAMDPQGIIGSLA